MLERKITKDIDWWYKNCKSSLLIDGARQVGKTTVIENYLKDNKIDYLELNLATNGVALDVFNTSKDAEQILLRLSALTPKKLIPGKTVIFIDEIQEANDAITPIKSLTLDGRYRFIFSGSLLGIKMKNIRSIPVGYLRILQMYPLDFEEFMNAFSVASEVIEHIRKSYEDLLPVDEVIHKQMLSLFRVYLVVGGMPAAVDSFIKHRDIVKVNEALEEIDAGYRKDITRYDNEEKLLIEDIYNLIPSELNHQNKRFILKNLNEKARFYKYDTSFVWLKDSGVGLFAYNADNPIYPLLASKERTLFKLFLCDVGLLTYKLFSGNQAEILNGSNVLNIGSIYEAVVAQELKCHGFDLFYNSDKKRGEIDFLIEKDNKVIPIEVKSGKDYKRHSSLSNLLVNESYGIDEGIILSNGNVEKKDKRVYLPIYMIMFIKKRKQMEALIVDMDISELTKFPNQ